MHGVVLRPLGQPGDLGWVVQAHGELYAREFGWDATFERSAAEVLLGFLRDHDPAREAGWIAEVDGARAGSIVCVRTGDEAVAKLRVLLVHPDARGRGVGRVLVDTCIAFARDAGYQHLELWTVDVLVSARRIYDAAGFRLVDEEPRRELFGAQLVGQTLALDLTAPTAH
ncbi:GNAT family N-acetyltransferase [Conexibacter sp. SYSU D00693]|uniref:GNAT family N-acetyltransferase n=1 Tax=Conexibacter sp. SYSU D00693 TaxID=2812560 RepID=UPI00196A590E|nr:GNAT family N-acetyltransferase [Conexibacter sp. SYSU D00693]